MAEVFGELPRLLGDGPLGELLVFLGELLRLDGGLPLPRSMKDLLAEEGEGGLDTLLAEEGVRGELLRLRGFSAYSMRPGDVFGDVGTMENVLCARRSPSTGLLLEVVEAEGGEWVRTVRNWPPAEELLG